MMISEPEALREQFIQAYRSLLLSEGMNIQECRFEWCEGGFVHRETAVAWWAWQASRERLRVTNPFPVQMGDPDAAWAREVAEKSLRAQGLKVVG
ncbi:hypothetical protein [Pseudomonas putida]|uniref:hypothetical protein n=1 Tax=Pseudomonas putida TaxID=303 RepID=UPI0023E45737|nr:hypothetical protein [Pseudomonas putida]MDF3928480.1 hypothetical protein [Pseudomonas putida]